MLRLPGGVIAILAAGAGLASYAITPDRRAQILAAGALIAQGSAALPPSGAASRRPSSFAVSTAAIGNALSATWEHPARLSALLLSEVGKSIAIALPQALRALGGT